jgi:hypothetical protein
MKKAKILLTIVFSTAWPTIFIIDKRGKIRYLKVGEGNHKKTEDTIKTASGRTGLNGFRATTYSNNSSRGTNYQDYLFGECSATLLPSVSVK